MRRNSYDDAADAMLWLQIALFALWGVVPLLPFLLVGLLLFALSCAS